MRQTAVRSIFAGILTALLAGCAAPVGDFGRQGTGLFSTTINEFAGPTSPAFQKPFSYPSSPFALTDEERDLRNIGWDLVRPPDRDVPGNAIFEFAWWRALPDGWYANYPAAYYSALFTLPVASHETRYARLIAQVNQDVVRVPTFRLAATKVAKADGARRAALSALRADTALNSATEKRISENIGVVRNVCQALMLRRDAYRYVLARLVVETPSTRAVEAEAAIDALAWEISACLPAGVGEEAAAAPAATGARQARGQKRLPPLITK